MLRFGLLCLLASAVSGQAEANDKVQQRAKQAVEEAQALERGGKIAEAVVAFREAAKKYAGTALTEEDDLEFDAHGPAVASYGELAAFELKFAERRLKEGSVRASKTPSERLAPFLAALKNGDSKKIGALLWVRTMNGRCQSHLEDVSPEEAAVGIAAARRDVSGQLLKFKVLKEEKAPDGHVESIIAGGFKDSEVYQFSLLNHRPEGWAWTTVTACRDAKSL